jgi:uncharacterized membrane protein YdbT with pleckstrin-like domain
MFEFEKKHKGGKKTFFYLFLTKGWWLNIIGIALLYLSWFVYFGKGRIPTENFLGQHPTWYIDITMLASWFLMFGIAFIFVAYLIANVHYRLHKFILDEYAIHLHRGLFSIKEITIPYQQINNVHIERSSTYRMFGICQLDIITASDHNRLPTDGKNRKFLIPIIDTSIARKLSRHLLESASQDDDEDFEDDDTDNESDDFDEDDEE